MVGTPEAVLGGVIKDNCCTEGWPEIGNPKVLGDGVNLLGDGVDLLVDGVDLLVDGVNLLVDGVNLLGEGVDLLGDGVDLLGDGGDLLGDELTNGDIQKYDGSTCLPTYQRTDMGRW